VLAGIILTIFYIRTDFRVTIPVFAIFSYYMEMKFMAIFKTNFADELILLSFVGGFFMLVFSKDRRWKPDLDLLKGPALFKALFFNSILMLFSILFIYGQGFFAVMVFNLFSTYILYLIFYHRMKIREMKAEGKRSDQ